MAKVLIIDDDPLMYELYQLILTTAGHEVAIAEAPELAVERALAFEPEVILLDIMMPKMNGLELLQLFRASSRLKKIPVVAFSNLLDKEAEQEAYRRGAVRYIIKSQFQAKELQALIVELLEKNGKSKGLPKL